MGTNGASPHAYYGHVDGAAVLRLTGPVRFVAAQALRHFVDDRMSIDDGGIVLDLRSIDCIDSTGMGLLARIGRASLRLGRRASIVCGDRDITTTLRSAAFDELFVMLDAYPFDDEAATLAEVPLDGRPGTTGDLGLGRIILEAHRDLASLSDRNLEAYREVIAALEADLRASH